MSHEKIVMLRNENRLGASILKKDYRKIAEFILTTLSKQPEKRIELNDLIVRAHIELDRDFRGDVSWHLLQVKRDLEARGIIQASLTPFREQFIQVIKAKEHLDQVLV